MLEITPQVCSSSSDWACTGHGQQQSSFMSCTHFCDQSAASVAPFPCETKVAYKPSFTVVCFRGHADKKKGDFILPCFWKLQSSSLLEYRNHLQVLLLSHHCTTVLIETKMSCFSIMGYCFFSSTTYALLHLEYRSNWPQSQQSLILYNKNDVTIWLPLLLMT